MVNFKEIYHFSSFQRGSSIFQGGGGGSNFFQGGGGGSNCLFPIQTHITCDFPGGSGPPVPPLDPHLNLAWDSKSPNPFQWSFMRYLNGMVVARTDQHDSHANSLRLLRLAKVRQEKSAVHLTFIFKVW